MSCPYEGLCGGCSYRHLSQEEYRELKIATVEKILSPLKTSGFRFQNPVFISDGQRRRAAFAFSFVKGKLSLGFNQKQSREIVDIENCCLLTPKINQALPAVKNLLAELCRVKLPQKKKNKVVGYKNLAQGDVLITQAENGLDVVLQFAEELNLDYRMIVSEFMAQENDVIRISHRQDEFSASETLVEKVRPYIKIAGYEVYIPAGTFLQASKASEQKMTEMVVSYVPEGKHKIADLFCGVGTFSYPLAKNPENKILSVDSSASLLEGFRQSVNKNMISNIEIAAKNLFKYPLDEQELSEFDIVVFDPPRAGALAQVNKIAAMGEKAPSRVIAVSCNPHSFVRDAEILLTGGYALQEVTLIDQFPYSNHSELVALFTK